MPAIYESSFNAWRGLRVPVPHGANPVIVGFREQTAVVTTGIKSLIERAVLEGVSMVVEGIHLVPGYIEPSVFTDAWVVQLIITVDDEDAHRSHFYIREVQTEGTRPFEKYRDNFDNIRMLGHYIEDLAKEHGTPVIHSHQLDRTVAETLEKVISAVTGDRKEEARPKRARTGTGRGRREVLPGHRGPRRDRRGRQLGRARGRDHQPDALLAGRRQAVRLPRPPQADLRDGPTGR